MEKYVIQDVDDKKYYADNNQWSDTVNDALHFSTQEEALKTAYQLNVDYNYTLTVIFIIY